jgi:hypothetical protein
MPLVVTGNKRSVTSRLALELVNQGIRFLTIFFEISELFIQQSNHYTVATDELLCLENGGTQISIVLTLKCW